MPYSNLEAVERMSAALGSLQAKVDNLEEEMQETRKDIREIRDTLTGVKGSWKTLVAVGSILSTIIIAVTLKIVDIFSIR